MDVQARIKALREAGMKPDELSAFLDELESALQGYDPYAAITSVVDGLTSALDDFAGSISGTTEERETKLRASRRQFGVQLATLLQDAKFTTKTEPGSSAGASLGGLRTSLRGLATRTGSLVEQNIRDSQYDTELQAAGRVQQMLVPGASKSVAGLTAHAWFQPADRCAGDWWCLEPAGDDAIIFVGDVTGHGAASALVASLVKGATDLARLGMGRQLRPFQLMSMLNRVIADAVKGELFMTGVGLRFQSSEQTMSICNAGHRAVWHLRSGRLTPVPGGGAPPLGADPLFRYEERTMQLRSGDRLFLFTDGIPECESPSGEEFGERGLKEAVLAAREPENVIEAVKERVTQHVGKRAHIDDLTLVVLDVD